MRITGCDAHRFMSFVTTQPRLPRLSNALPPTYFYQTHVLLLNLNGRLVSTLVRYVGSGVVDSSVSAKLSHPHALTLLTADFDVMQS